MNAKILTKGGKLLTFGGTILQNKGFVVGDYYIGDEDAYKSITGTISVDGNTVNGSDLPYTSPWSYTTVGSDNDIQNLLIVNKGGNLTKIGNMVFRNSSVSVKYILDCRNIDDVYYDARLLYQNTSIISADLSGIYNIPNGYNLKLFAQHCSNLQTVDISSWDMTNFDWGSAAMTNCQSLQRIYVDDCPDVTITKTIAQLNDAYGTPSNWVLSTYQNRRVLIPTN